MANKKIEILKFYISHPNCPRMTLRFKDKEICLTNTLHYFIPNTPENQEEIKFLRHSRFVACSTQIEAMEFVDFIFNPKNFPFIEKMLRPGSDAVTINKFKPEDEEDIVANLKKRGYKFIAPEDGKSMIYSLEEAKVFLESMGYEVKKVESVQVNTDELGRQEFDRDISTTTNKYAEKKISELRQICQTRKIKMPFHASRDMLAQLISDNDYNLSKEIIKPKSSLDDIDEVLNTAT